MLCVKVMRPGERQYQHMDDIRFGLTYLRENPKLLPLMIPGDDFPHYMASLEICREVEEERDSICRDVEGTLLMGLIRCKGASHIGFW